MKIARAIDKLPSFGYPTGATGGRPGTRVTWIWWGLCGPSARIIASRTDGTTWELPRPLYFIQILCSELEKPCFCKEFHTFGAYVGDPPEPAFMGVGSAESSVSRVKNRISSI